MSRLYWPAFLDVLSDDNQNRLVSIHVLDENADDFQVLKQTTLRSVNYARTPVGTQVKITIGSSSTAYSHIVSHPRRIEVFYEQGEQIFAVAIIDDDKKQTVIYFENDALVVYGQPEPLLSILSGRSTASVNSLSPSLHKPRPKHKPRPEIKL